MRLLRQTSRTSEIRRGWQPSFGLPDPVPAAGEILIRVRASGLNHAETYMAAIGRLDAAAALLDRTAGTIISP